VCAHQDCKRVGCRFCTEQSNFCTKHIVQSTSH
jgi:hypothetical protein